MVRINLISGPRNISTALMYSFAQRIDTTVLDEPFYAFYLHKSGVIHPGGEDVLKSQPLDEIAVATSMFEEQTRPVLFIKNMAHHLELTDQRFLEDVTNIFLIRNPRQILASYAQVIETPTLRDIGIEYQLKLFHDLRAKGHQPTVVDSGHILENPESVLRQVCQRVGITFTKDMLQWEPGPKPYDGIWAKHWYANVHKSTGFDRQPTSNRPLPIHLEDVCHKAQYCYDKLVSFSLRP